MPLARSVMGPYFQRSPDWVRYATALAMFAAVLFVRVQLIPLVGSHSPLLPFVAPVLAASIACGAGPAALIAILTPLVGTPLLHPAFAWSDPIGWLAHVGLFALIAGAAIALIHQLQASHRQISESERRLRLATQSAGVGIFEWKLGPSPSFWGSELMLQLMGVPPGARIDDPLQWLAQRVHPDDFAKLDAHLRATHAPGTCELALRIRERPTDEWRHGILLATRTNAADGSIRIVGVARERTDEIRAQERSALLESIVLSSGDAIIGETLDGNVCAWNPAAERLFGHLAVEVLGRSARLITPPSHAAEDEDVTRRLLAGEPVVTCEVERLRSDGSLVAVAMSASLIVDEQGHRIGVCRILRDITEERRSRAALAKSELRFRQLADSMPQIVYVLDPDRNVLYLNKRWQEYTGRSTAVGEDVAAAIPAEDLQQLYSAWAEHAPKNESHSQEFRLRSRTGELRWFLRRACPIFNEDGAVEIWVGTSTDIHEHKQAHLALQEADRRKNEFLAMLAHELRNPLAPVLNIASALEKKGNDAAAVQQMSAILRRQTAHLARMVDDLLDVSRISRGKITLKRERMMLQSALERALEIVHPQLIAKSQSVKLAAPSRAVPIDGDVVRLTQVFGNLLSNASKFSPPESKIVVTLELRGSEVAVSVRDQGAGMDAQLLPHVFDLFVQADQSLDRSQGGLGIGLTIARRLVELHGGRIDARSEGLGRGSEFVVTLPVSEHTPPQIINAAEVRAPQMRILIVDDNVDAAISLAMLLEMQDHEVRTAHDGASALAMLEQFLPDVMLLDIGLPGIDGYTLAEMIRSRLGAGSPRLIALSGYANEDSREADARFDAYLIKPVQPQLLSQVIAAHAPRPDVPPGVYDA